MWSTLGRFLIALLVNPCFLAYHGGCSTNWFPVIQKQPTKTPAADEAEFTRLRERMVREQLQGRDITDARVLAAMLKVPRHEFVLPEYRNSAYSDNALPLKMGQTISQPYIVAYMTQALELRGTERVLEIGTGSGYQAAVLAEIASEVYTIEILPELGEYAKSILGSLGYRNIDFGSATAGGWPEKGPSTDYCHGGSESVPQPLIDQLRRGPHDHPHRRHGTGPGRVRKTEVRRHPAYYHPRAFRSHDGQSQGDLRLTIRDCSRPAIQSRIL
jgi:protein-L-isoaspartate(D-aspartate) O-methyltransferase